MDKLGPLLRGGLWDTAGRLLNVAISRPRGKLIIVLDSQYLNDQQGRLGAGAQHVALLRLLKNLQGLRIPQHVLTVAQFDERLHRLPACSLRGFEHVRSAEVIGARIHDPTGARWSSSARRQLLMYVHGGGPVSSWVERSRQQNNADIYVRGRSLHPSWHQVATPVWNAGIGSDLSFSAFVADGFRAGIDLRGAPGCLSLHMPTTAHFLARGLQLVPPNFRVIDASTATTTGQNEDSSAS